MPALQPERRQLLKAGALVWTVPVIAMATAAPAYASSGAVMAASSGTNPLQPFSRRGTGGAFFIDANLTLRNTGTSSTSALTVTITVPSGVSATGQVAPADWSVTVLNTTQVRFALLVPPATQIAGPTGERVVSFTVRRSAGNASELITAVVDPGGGGIPGTITGTAS